MCKTPTLFNFQSIYLCPNQEQFNMQSGIEPCPCFALGSTATTNTTTTTACSHQHDAQDLDRAIAKFATVNSNNAGTSAIFQTVPSPTGTAGKANQTILGCYY
jgi:hypothetical protein